MSQLVLYCEGCVLTYMAIIIFFIEKNMLPPTSYAQAVKPRMCHQDDSSVRTKSLQLCQYALSGVCPLGDDCEYAHGELCDTCGCQVLHPYDEELRLAHEKVSSQFSKYCGRSAFPFIK